MMNFFLHANKMLFILIFVSIGLVLSENRYDEVSEELGLIDPFELDLVGCGDLQIKLTKAAKAMIDVIQSELKIDHKLKPQEKKKLENELNGFIEDLSELQMQLLTLNVETIHERRRLVNLVEIFNVMIKTMKKYLEAGSHKSVMEKMSYGFKEFQKNFKETVKNFGSHAKKVARYLAHRGVEFEADDDDPEESKNVYFTAISTDPVTPRKEVFNQVMLPLGSNAIYPTSTKIDSSLYDKRDDDTSEDSQDSTNRQTDDLYEDDEDDVIDDGSSTIGDTLNDKSINSDSTGQLLAQSILTAGGTDGVGLAIQNGRLIISIPLTALPQVYQLKNNLNSVAGPVSPMTPPASDDDDDIPALDYPDSAPGRIK